ncbi:MAG: glycosyltransferase family 2 protein [Planctomycetota bacterium]
MPNCPSVSAIISNLNGLKFLPRLLQSLREQCGVVIQIIVVDRMSRDGSLEYLAGQADVEVIHEPPETGLVSGYAAGVSCARHELLFFCNEDMWFDTDCLRLLQERIDLQAGIVAADPWQWTYDGRQLIHAGTRFKPSCWNILCSYPFRQFCFTESVVCGEIVPFPCAGAFLMYRKAYEQAGGWDRSFFLDHEDVDLFIRVWQLGQRCVSVPEARVYHAVGASNQQQIATLNTPVKRKRHISGLANIAVIGMKYFNSWASFYCFLYPLFVIIKEAVRLRPRQTWLSVLAAIEVAGRYSAVRQFRAVWSRENTKRPGQGFFTAPEFALGAAPYGLNTSSKAFSSITPTAD